MREYEKLIEEGLKKGLRVSSRNARNEQALIQSDGMIPEDGVLRAVDSISLLANIETLGESFPYPQVFVAQSYIIVAGETRIWEYSSGLFKLVLTGMAAGSMWTLADFHDYLVIANGNHIMRRNASNQSWEDVIGDSEMPVSNCVAGINGQLFVGGPQEVF